MPQRSAPTTADFALVQSIASHLVVFLDNDVGTINDAALQCMTQTDVVGTFAVMAHTTDAPGRPPADWESKWKEPKKRTIKYDCCLLFWFWLKEHGIY